MKHFLTNCIWITFYLPSFMVLADELPEWVVTGNDKRYSETAYLQAVGQASIVKTNDKAFVEAEASACNQIAQQLQVHIAAKSVVVKFENEANQFVREQSSDETLTSTNVTLSGLRIEARFIDKKKKICYALAVLDRRIATEAMLAEMRTLTNSSNKALEAAGTMMNAHQPLSAMLSLRRAFGMLTAMGERKQILAVLRAKSLAPESLPEHTSVEQILQLLNQVGVSIAISSPQNSYTIRGRSELPYKIDITVFCSDQPLENFPLTCQFHQGRGAGQIGRTDAQGHADLIISQLKSAPHGEYAIEVLPDISDLLFPDDFVGGEVWDIELSQALRPCAFTLKSSHLELDDCVSGAVAELLSQLPAKDSGFKLLIGNMTYQKSGASSALVAYLKEKIALELAPWSQVQLLAPDRIDVSLRGAKTTYRGNKRPDRPEILADLIDADGMLVGNYWDRTDDLEFDLQIIQRQSAAVLASTAMTIPKNLLPTQMSYLPANFASFEEANRLGNVQQPKSDLQVDVWIDRADGAIYQQGEKLTVFIRASKDCNLYLIYHDAEGKDILIYPNARQANNRILSGVIYQIPDSRDTFNFTIQPPFGSEILKAIVANKNLPELPGRLLPNGLTLLRAGLKESLLTTRGISMQGREKHYAEGSCVVTTIARLNP